MKHFGESKLRLSLITYLGIILIFSSPSVLSTLVSADDLNPGIYSRDSKPFGTQYGDWLVRWSQWFIQIPADINPREHYTPERCATDQSGPVWFLTDILKEKEERTCTIPSDKAILLPILSGTCWTDKTDPIPMTEQEITKCAMAGNEYGKISATLDGKTIQNLNNYRTQSPFFNITVPENNVFNNMPGVWKAKTDGFFLFLEPLSPGNHTLSTTTSVFNPLSPEYNYGSTLTYKLIVKP